ncbi:PAT1 domain containing protein [Pyrenophora teres f. teres]|uniref:PAT1 domain containing protein n=1 Tax=Pyrenophora teres f. teres TaxID=97479 RepID=A0A6S6WDA5_9PLEO|nr:PAT1 domain containing protein [Pyrenophora teres f. teres]
MADVMSQQGLSAPTSRQDIISALLNDYATSFGRGDACTSVYSPVQELKSLPPTPNDISRKQLPPGVQAMHAKFQLRDDQDAPLSPTSPLQDSPRSRKRIVSRSLSRGSKPPSLNLTVSNGSTATIPPTPALPPQKQSVPNKDLPPPPPHKSERRQSLRQGDMGSKMSKTRESAKRDSLLSQGEPAEVSPQVVKRKAVPEAMKKFKSLAELGNGPRGRKGAPTSRTSVQRDESVDSQRSNSTARNASVESKRDMRIPSEPQPNEQPRNMRAELPPTPDEEKDEAKPPAPPKKVFTGLPSNPRGKAPASPLHMRGKSSTGFNVLKAMRPAPPPPNVPDMRTMTPEMTPSPPSLKPGATNNDSMISPLSLLPAPTDQRRRFSYEPAPAVQPMPVEQKPVTVTAAPVAPASKSPTAELRVQLSRPSLQTPEPTSAGFHPRSSDLEDFPLSPEPGPSVPSSPVQSVPAVQDAAVAPVKSLPAPLPLPPPVEVSPPPPSKVQPVPPVQAVATPKSLPTPPLQQQKTISPTLPSPPVQTIYQQPQQPQQSEPQKPLPQEPKIPAPFSPLTRHPVPLPIVPAITPAHLNCYSAHRHNIWSNNTFQPMACMVCRENNRERKWTCTWCQLRICGNCSEELKAVPGRDLARMMEIKEDRARRALGVVVEE